MRLRPMWCLVVWSIPSLVGAPQAEKPALTGDPATDAWDRTLAFLRD